MAVKTSLTGWLKIFGAEAVGSTAVKRAASSNVRFVRSQDELSLWNRSAKGRVFTAKEALLRFGEATLMAVWREGSAILSSSPIEPAKTLRERRESLGLTQTEFSHNVGLSLDAIARAESPDFTSRIEHLCRIAMALGLDEAILGFEPGANGDQLLAIRLKAWNTSGAKPNTIGKLSRISWIVATQAYLQQLVTLNKNQLEMFVASDDYGDASYPVWDRARDLARETRKQLGFTEREPILSLRDLCHRLHIPLVHAELPPNIAGATLATGNARGVVVNVNGNDKNVWVQRATVAHELGHLLWDPDERLQSLVVDSREQIEKIDLSRNPKDYVEARANAFAVELLAPRDAIRDYTGPLDTNDHASVAKAIRANMERFGLSATAMRYHLWNAYERAFDLDGLPFIDPVPTEEWKASEQFTDDYFPLANTPMERRGEFASLVVRAQAENWLAEETAALYLEADLDAYRTEAIHIMGLY